MAQALLQGCIIIVNLRADGMELALRLHFRKSLVMLDFLFLEFVGGFVIFRLQLFLSL